MIGINVLHLIIMFFVKWVKQYKWDSLCLF